jgi:tetratricopeptide (TPR) repeat protein
VWLPRRLELIERAPGPVVLAGGEAYGVPFLIEALRARHRLAWAVVPARLGDDPVGQGNALAAAIDGLLAAPLLTHALPYGAHLQTLRRHAADLLPLWIALTTDDVESAFVGEVVALADAGYRILLDIGGTDPAPVAGPGRTIVGPDDLRVAPAEAPRIVPGGLDGDVVAELQRATAGRFTDLVTKANQLAQLPPLHVPSPAGRLVPAAEARLVAPAVAVQALQHEGAYVEALELAVLRAPDLVEDLLRTAGPAHQEHGLLRRLHLLLTAVPAPYATRERVLEWRLVAALAADELAAVVADVDAHLQAYDAPDLRARRAGTLPRPLGFPLAQAAVAAKRTPLTVWQYGRMHPDPVAATEILRESVLLAEDVGTPYDRVRNAGALAAKLVHRGEFTRAGAWAQWGLDVFDQYRLRDGARRLALYNDLAVARIFSGDVAGLRRGLEDVQAAVDGNLPEVAAYYRSTLAYLELATGRPEAALALLRASYAGSPRRTRSRYAYQYVRALLEGGRHEEALRVAEEAMEVSGPEIAHRRLAGQLARGMARAVAGRDGACDDLFDVMHAVDLPAEQRTSAALHYLLASDGAGHHVPGDVATMLSRLTPMALAVLSGPAERFQGVWDSLALAGPGLHLEFLGRVTCRLDGVRVALPLRLAEVALALALHPEGIGRDALNDFLTPDGHVPFSKGSIRALITRLRSHVPVSDAPYRLAVPAVTDVVEVRQRLAAGQVREAIALLRGPLLPESQAPGVEEQRARLEEELRQAALLAGDADALFDLADRFVDDLQVWEATVGALAPGDPRVALAQARVRRLERDFAARPA